MDRVATHITAKLFTNCDLKYNIAVNFLVVQSLNSEISKVGIR